MRLTKLFLSIPTALFLLAAFSFSEVVVKPVEYKHGAVALRGYVAKPEKIPAGGAPGVLLIHDWIGASDYSQKRVKELAQAGFVAFAVDMYGAGKLAKDNAEAAQLSGAFYKDRKLMVERVKAGLDELKKTTGLKKENVAVIGFCFGGAVALQLARSGEPLSGVVSFHGGLKTDAPAGSNAIKTKILVLHGGADPFVPVADMAGFMDEMNKAGANWRMEVYGGAVHGFTKAESGNDPSKGMAYNEDAEKRSFAAMYAFFKEIFSGK